VVVGDGPDASALRGLSASLGVDDRVSFRGFVDEASKKALYARATAVFYAPWDEDYGLVTLEAFHSRKPIVTTFDAGGPLELVRDGETGLVVAPEPAAIGAALSHLLSHKAEAGRLGENAFASVRHITWDPVVESLTRTLS
jgi:glycosyltransferase involved in cell wall biosynthesis